VTKKERQRVKNYQLAASIALPIELLVPGAAPAFAIINIKVFAEIEPNVLSSLGVFFASNGYLRTTSSR
jgi:hypothetical protein